MNRKHIRFMRLHPFMTISYLGSKIQVAGIKTNIGIIFLWLIDIPSKDANT